MKKIGIITLNGEFNYGNRLQNFALQKVFLNYNVQAETIVITQRKIDKFKKVFWIGNINYKKDFISLLKKFFYKITITSIKRRRNYHKMQVAKGKIVREFSKYNINSRIIEKKDLEQLNHQYDLFIVGSDQVWNPNIIEFDTDYFLNFIPEEKRYSYSASFGVECIPKKPYFLKEHFSSNLKKMSYISVREASGAKLVETLIGKKVDIAPDPTLLLDKEEWCKELSITKEKEDQFLLIYFVSELSNEIEQEIKRFANQRKLSIIHIMGDTFGNDRIIVDPQQFVSLIAQAQYVFTDSFHGSVFSIIMQTPFFVYERTDHKGTNTRIENLVCQFQMEHAIVSLGEDLSAKELLFDFERSRILLEKERKRGHKLIEQKILNYRQVETE